MHSASPKTKPARPGSAPHARDLPARNASSTGTRPSRGDDSRSASAGGDSDDDDDDDDDDGAAADDDVPLAALYEGELEDEGEAMGCGVADTPPRRRQSPALPPELQPSEAEVSWLMANLPDPADAEEVPDRFSSENDSESGSEGEFKDDEIINIIINRNCSSNSNISSKIGNSDDVPRWLALKPGLVYDARMCSHAHLTDPSHPEAPSRIVAIWDGLVAAGLVSLCERVPAREARTRELLACHSWAHVRTVRLLEQLSPGLLALLAARHNSVYLNADSSRAAALSAGSLIELTLRVARGELRSGAAIIRPPGHHAEAHTCMGFCLYNNVALAARAALDRASSTVSRVLIVDWDVHHGNGTQHMFYDTKSVLYVSLHRHDYGTFFPASPDGGPDCIGQDAGRGFNVNIAWNGSDRGDADYIAAFNRLVMPVACEYSPDLVIVSAGFDAAEDDPLGGCCLTPAGYAYMTHSLMALAGGRVVVALEGGYNLNSISACMRAVVETLLGKPPPPISWRSMRPLPGSLHDIAAAIEAQMPFWHCLREGSSQLVLVDGQELFFDSPAAAAQARVVAEAQRKRARSEAHGGEDDMPPAKRPKREAEGQAAARENGEDNESASSSSSSNSSNSSNSGGGGGSSSIGSDSDDDGELGTAALLME